MIKIKSPVSFKKTFLLADISIDITFGMLFLTLSNAKINSNNQELKWRLYTAAKALSTIKQVELIEKKKFVATALDPKNKIFIIHVVSLVISDNVYPLYKVSIVLLKVNETFTIIFSEYFDFTDVFF